MLRIINLEKCDRFEACFSPKTRGCKDMKKEVGYE